MQGLKALHKKKQQEALTHESADAVSPSALSNTSKSSSSQVVGNAAELRVQKDVSEIKPILGVKLEFPNPDNLMAFDVHLTPTDGIYKGARFDFSVSVPASYPFDPPKVLCKTLVYHPNIDWEGKVCLNILRAEWVPVLTLESVLFGLMHLFLEPNAEDPLNKDAADKMADHPREFERIVKETLRGGKYFGKTFPKLL